MNIIQTFCQMDTCLSPENLKEKLKPDSKVRVMLLLDDEEAAWNNFAMTQFLKGYSEKDSIYDKL